MIKYRVNLVLMKMEEHKVETLSNEGFDFIIYDLAYEVFQRMRLFLLTIRKEFKK